ncbi:flagellar filament capping protein FliD [Alkalimarinus sediminis]|uniref:Flagellar hook-associated protein 2 n=1 Tax=Alkalimarinus sediminis TaxID=1632866 RepID=A0A9E8KR08_9ALTE|nr:flagellar filament capping protein FliD [Alkalimarinus sediminis]UZW75785.1 flagellar filament capping protein FliD [Alkalimarinus sediminis]
MSVSSIGIGSGVLTSDLIDQLANAERAPTELRFDRKEEQVQAELSAVGRIRNALTDLRLPTRVLSNPNALQSLNAESSSGNVSATAGSGASVGQYSLEVTDLAQAQSLSSATFADKNLTALGTGTLSIKVGDVTKDIAIDGSNNTLEGIASAINAEEDLAVNASVIDTGSGFVLVFAAQNSGTENGIEISVNDTGDGNNTDVLGLSQLSFDGTNNNLTESVVAKDALFSVNGILITRQSNTVSDAIDGVTFTLTGKTNGSPATVSITQDTEQVLERIQNFVEAFNEVKTILNEVTAFDPNNSEETGLLLGDSTVRSINSQLRGVLSQVVPGLDGSAVRSLAEVGISTDRQTGLLSVDDEMFTKALSQSPDDVIALFAEQGRASDAQVTYSTKGANTVPGNYDIEITQAATNGSFTGASVIGASTVIDTANDTFKISVDGTESADIVLTAGTYTQSELLTELQKQLDADANLNAAGASISVSYDGSGQLQFTSGTFGSDSKVSFTAVDTNTLATLGIDAIAGVDGLNVEGTINGEAATGKGQFLTGAEGDDSEGLVVKVEGSSIGSRGSVTFIEGIGDQLVDKLNSFLEFEGIIGAKESGLKDQLDEITKGRAQLDLRVENLRTRLSLQFTAADILVSQLNSTQDFLKSQLATLTGAKDD